MSRELLKRSIELCELYLSKPDLVDAKAVAKLRVDIEAEFAKPGPEPIEIDWPEYHYQGMGGGIEDRGINDRYEACRYGWDCALDAVAERLPEKLYTDPPRQVPVLLSDEDCDCVCHAQGRYPSYNFIRAVEQLVLKVNGLIK